MELTNISAKLRMVNAPASQTSQEIIVINVLPVITIFLLARHANVILLDLPITNVSKIRDNVLANKTMLESNVMSAKMVIGIIQSVLVSDIL